MDGRRVITYSTNQMGPVNMDWYRRRGLTTTKTVIQEEDSRFTSRKKGDVYDVEEVNEHWAAGRIDIRGDELGPYGDEMGLPVMRGDCYGQFSDWLDGVRTEQVWTLAQLVERYEKSNPKIVWAADI